MLDIQIKTIKHSKQRYSTCGDWLIHGNTLTIYVSEMCDWRKEALVAVHELIETLCCKNKGVSQKEVDLFDMDYEANRHPSDLTSEPGDDPAAPYHVQHKFASIIERMLAEQLEVKWEEYEAVIQNL